MNGAGTSIYNKLSDVAAEVSKARAVLQGVETYVEYHFQDGRYGELQALIKHNAGNVQVLLHVMSSMLSKAETAAEELDDMLHGVEEKGACA